MVRVLKLTLAYDGTGYVGWQRQENGVSIQALLEDGLARIEGALVAVAGAGRTDAGVHAVGQVASFSLHHDIVPDALVHALNSMLPADVRALDAVEEAAGFHARHDAQRKTYRYRLVTGGVAGPFDRLYAWHLPSDLDLDALRTAAAAIVGTHDFAAFQSVGGSVRTSVRTVYGFGIEAAPHEPVGDLNDGATLVTLEITADGFLRHMVRSIVGTLVDVGLGRRECDSVGRTLASLDRAQAGPTAPAHGLFLVRVDY